MLALCKAGGDNQRSVADTKVRDRAAQEQIAPDGPAPARHGPVRLSRYGCCACFSSCAKSTVSPAGGGVIRSGALE